MLPKEINVNNWEIPAGRVATRAAVRFPLRLPLRIETETGPVQATTENVSSNGLLFLAPTLPRVGSAVEFTITMPAPVMGSDTDVSIHCFGRIVRHHLAGECAMAAAVIDEYFLKV
jgi:hypothetical protein